MKLSHLAVLVTATTCAAQVATTLPRNFAGTEATGATNVPLGRAQLMRAQMFYGSRLFGWTKPKVIQGLAFRADGSSASGRKRVELQAWLSTCPLSLQTVSSRFAENRGKDQSEVFRKRSVVLSAMLARSKAEQDLGPAPFTLNLPLDRPFSFDPTKGPMALEMLTHAQQRGSYLLDSTYACQQPLTYAGPAGCGRPGAPALKVEMLSAQLMWGSRGALQVQNAAPGALTMLLFGAQTRGVWQGISLPYDARSIGAPGCHLSIGIIALSKGRADSAGNARFSYAIPAIPALRGFAAYVQGLSEAPKANPLGLITSQPARLQICGWESVARVYGNGIAATTGQAEIGVAPVLRLTTK